MAAGVCVATPVALVMGRPSGRWILCLVIGVAGFLFAALIALNPL